MFRMNKHIKDWAPAAASICAVLLTAAYAVTRESRATDSLLDASSLASSLAEAAKTAEQTARSPEQIEEVSRKRADLEQRMEDSRKPGCIVAELSETARKAGLVLREIQPCSSVSRPAGQPESHKEYPQYRIQVHGTYAQIAEYMARCGSQRIPARVREFRIGRVRGPETAEAGVLAAELVVEAFQPIEPEKPGTKDK